MKEIEIKIAAFFASPNLRTVCGAPFEILTFDKDGNGNIKQVVGSVTETTPKKDGEGTEDVKVEMLWTPNGSAMCNKPLIYDLVERLPIADLGKDEEAK